jgi:hypothetical protein
MYIHNHETKNVLAFEYRNLLAGCRVTRFCEFSPIGRGVSLDSFFVNYKSGANIWTMYGFLRCKLCTFLTKRVGLNFGQFFPKLIWPPWLAGSQSRFWANSEATFNSSSDRSKSWKTAITLVPIEIYILYCFHHRNYSYRYYIVFAIEILVILHCFRYGNISYARSNMFALVLQNFSGETTLWM